MSRTLSWLLSLCALCSALTALRARPGHPLLLDRALVAIRRPSEGSELWSSPIRLDFCILNVNAVDGAAERELFVVWAFYDRTGGASEVLRELVSPGCHVRDVDRPIPVRVSARLVAAGGHAAAGEAVVELAGAERHQHDEPGRLELALEAYECIFESGDELGLTQRLRSCLHLQGTFECPATRRADSADVEATVRAGVAVATALQELQMERQGWRLLLRMYSLCNTSPLLAREMASFVLRAERSYEASMTVLQWQHGLEDWAAARDDDDADGDAEFTPVCARERVGEPKMAKRMPSRHLVLTDREAIDPPTLESNARAPGPAVQSGSAIECRAQASEPRAKACVLRGLTMQRLPCIIINQACVLRNVCLQRGERAYELTYFSPDGRGYPAEYTFSLITSMS